MPSERDARVLHFGSLTARVEVDRPEFLAFLTEYYRLRAGNPDADGATAGVRLVLSIAASPRRPADEATAWDGIESRSGERYGETWVRTARASARVHRRADAVHVDISAGVDGHVDDVVRYHVFVVLNKVLAQLGYLHLHAAAALLGGRVFMFAGDKGAGKSTLCLAIARAGGTVIAEDHVMLRRLAGSYVISGSDGVLRVTAQTEALFFDVPLDLPEREFAGVPKKEVPIEGAVPCAPYTDFAVDVLCLPRIADSLTMQPVSRQAALLHFLGALRWQHRFADAVEQAGHLAFLADFVSSVPVYTLTLSRDVTGIVELPAMLEALP
jgi:hypothetical protein